MVLLVNGKSRQFAAVSNVADLLAALGLTGGRVAVELNGAIVPRAAHAVQPLAENDQLEIVHAIGGG